MLVLVWFCFSLFLDLCKSDRNSRERPGQAVVESDGVQLVYVVLISL